MLDALRYLRYMYAGRLGRAEFIQLTIGIIVIFVVGNFLLINPMVIGLGGFMGPIFSFIVMIVYALCTSHVFVRRLHDIGLSGWWVFVGFITILSAFLGILLLLVLIFFKGNLEKNEYGFPPFKRSLVGAFLNT